MPAIKRHYFVFTAALLLFSACQKEPVPGSEPTPKSPITLTAEEAVRLPLFSDSYTVSHKEAEDYARSLAAALIRNGTATKGIRETKYPSYGFHQNWGWGETGNNWMAAGCFIVISIGTHYDFGLNNKMITGIRPR